MRPLTPDCLPPKSKRRRSKNKKFRKISKYFVVVFKLTEKCYFHVAVVPRQPQPLCKCVPQNAKKKWLISICFYSSWYQFSNLFYYLLGNIQIIFISGLSIYARFRSLCSFPPLAPSTTCIYILFRLVSFRFNPVRSLCTISKSLLKNVCSKLCFIAWFLFASSFDLTCTSHRCCQVRLLRLIV